MTAKPKKTNLQLPPGLSPAEEARWWDAHRDYWDVADVHDERLDSLSVRRTKAVNLRLPIDMIEALKVEAARRSITYQTLINTWLKERLDAEARSSDL